LEDGLKYYYKVCVVSLTCTPVPLRSNAGS